MNAGPQVFAPRAFAPTQRAPSPAWLVTRASRWHLMSSHVKVRWVVNRGHLILLTVIRSSPVWCRWCMTFLTYSVGSGRSLSRWQQFGKSNGRASDLLLVCWWRLRVCVIADVNECEDTSLCLGGQCTNTIGSYSCSCPAGLELVDGVSCRGIYKHRLT